MRRAVLLAGFLVFSGCTAHMPAAVSTTSIGDHERPVSIATGKSSAWWIFGFGPFGDDSISTAIKEAVEGTGADTMVNVFVDRIVYWFPFFRKITTSVHGTLIRYKDEEFDRMLPVPDERILKEYGITEGQWIENERKLNERRLQKK